MGKRRSEASQKLDERLERAARGGPGEIRRLVHDPGVEVLDALLRNPALSEEHLLTLLNRKDLPGELLESVSKNKTLMSSQRVKAAVVRHPRVPRLVALRLLRFLYLFDLVAVTQQPGVPAEIKRLAEEQIIGRIQQVPLGQQVALARRGTARVAAALLRGGAEPVLPAALDNPQLTEAELLKVLRRDDAPSAVLQAVAQHAKWSHAYEVRLQLVRHPETPLRTALGFLPGLKPADLLTISTDKRMRPEVRTYVKAQAERRLRRG